MHLDRGQRREEGGRTTDLSRELALRRSVSELVVSSGSSDKTGDKGTLSSCRNTVGRSSLLALCRSM